VRRELELAFKAVFLVEAFVGHDHQRDSADASAYRLQANRLEFRRHDRGRSDNRKNRPHQ